MTSWPPAKPQSPSIGLHRLHTGADEAPRDLPGDPVSNEKNSRLTLYILVAIVAAVTLALVRPAVAIGFEVGGEIFLRLLTMMAVPLVMSSVMSGIIGLGDVRKLGRPGAFTVAYYLTTTVLAVVVGLVMVNLIQPGVGTIDQDTLDALAAEGAGIAATQEDATLGGILRNLLLTLFTDNLVSSATDTNLLPSSFLR